MLNKNTLLYTWDLLASRCNENDKLSYLRAIAHIFSFARVSIEAIKQRKMKIKHWFNFLPFFYNSKNDNQSIRWRNTALEQWREGGFPRGRNSVGGTLCGRNSLPSFFTDAVHVTHVIRWRCPHKPPLPSIFLFYGTVHSNLSLLVILARVLPDK